MIEIPTNREYKDLPFARRLSERIPEVDGLRGLAILGILVYHCGEGINYEKSHWIVSYVVNISRIGSTGVDLFFVISGFLIGGILIDNRHSINYFKTFYLRRIFRIFPLYYVLIFIFCGLSVASAYRWITVAGWMVGFTFSAKWYLTFTQNFPMYSAGNLGVAALAPTWSLAVEEQFYLTLPFIIFFVPRKFLTAIVLVLICSASLFRALTWFHTSNLVAIRVLMPCCLDSLMMGVLVAILLRSYKPSILIERYGVKLITIVFTLLTTVLFLIHLFFANHYPQFERNPQALGSPLFALLYGALLIVVVTAKSGQLCSKFFSSALLIKIGKVSYFVYLFHIGINIFVRWMLGITEKPAFGSTWFIEISLSLFATLALAKLSWRYLEKPLINYSHRHNYKT